MSTPAKKQAPANRPRARRIVRLLLWLGVLLLLVSSPALWFRWANTLPPYTPPAVELPEPNGYTLAVELLVDLDESSLRQQAWWDGDPATLREGVAANSRVLDEFRALFSLAWRVPPPENPWGPFKAASSLRGAVLLLQAESELAALDGEAGRWLAAALDLLELASVLPKGTSQFQLAYPRLLQACGMESAEAAIRDAPVAALTAALPRLPRIRTHWPEPAETLEQERWLELWDAHQLAQQLRRSGLAAWATELSRLPSDRVYSWRKTSEVAALGLANKRTIIRNINSYYDGLITESRKRPAEQQVVHPAQDAYQRFVERMPLLVLRSSLFRVHTDLARLETLLAAELFRRERGRYPASLEEIPREWLPEVPLDGNGDPVTYRLEDGEPVVEGWLPPEPGGER